MFPEHIILQSAGSLSVAVLALLMVMVQTLFFFRKPRFTWYAWSAAISLSAFIYSVGIFLEYNTAQGELNRFSGLLEWTAIIFLLHCLYGFTFSYLGIQSRRYHPVAGACHGLTLALLWFTPYLVSDRFTAQHFLGLQSPYIEPALGPLGPLFVLYAAAASVIAAIVWIRHKRTDPNHRITYLAGMGFWILLGIHDGLASLGVPTLQYLMEYGFLGFATAVVWVVFSNHVEREAEEIVHQQKAEMQLILDSVPALIFCKDTNDRFTLVNKAAADRFKLSKEAMIGKTTDDILPEQAEAMKRDDREVIETGKPKTDVVESYTTPDGLRWAQTGKVPYRDSTGKVIGLIGVSVDITERKKSEEERKRREKQLSLITENIPGLVSYIDADGCYRFINKQYEKWFSLSSEQIIGKHYGHIIGDAAYRKIQTYIEKALSGKHIQYEEALPYKSGGRRWVHADYVPDIDEEGNVKGFFALVTDLTEQRQAEQEKAKLQTMLQRAQKMEALGRLITIVAHEILNPVNIISMRLQLMKKAGDLPDTIRKAVTICESQLDRIHEITKNLGEFSRIPKKQSTMSDLNTIIGHVLALYEPRFNADNIKTDIQFHPDLPQIPLDKDRIEQVIFNIISNANAAMEGKENKMLRITTKPTDSKDHVQVVISDNGTGIESSDMDRIFEPYFTTKNNPQDTGMGLFISHATIQDHGGRIWAENNEWGWVSFFIEFPKGNNMNS